MPTIINTNTNMDPIIFKAYDIRGSYPKEINEEVVAKIAREVRGRLGGGKIVVGHDARLSSPALYKSVLQSLKIKKFLPAHAYRQAGGRQVKFKIEAVGLATTPMLYFLVNKLKAAGGIMTTASHNPKEFNGLKIVGKKAIPISGAEIKKWFPLEVAPSQNHF